MLEVIIGYMLDLVKLTVRAGDGGNGRVSFLRQKFMPKGGPDGGDGGNGGNVYLRATKGMNTLQHFSGVKEFHAQPGGSGGADKMIGKKGDDIVLEVPIGTVVWLLAENKAGYNRRLHQQREGNVDPHIYFKKFQIPATGGMVPVRPADPLIPVNEWSEKAAENDDAIDEETGEASFGDGLENSVLPQANVQDFAQNTDDESEGVHRSEGIKNINLKTVPKLKLVEFLEDGQEILLCQGGFGGRGNVAFKGSTNTTPEEAEYGTFGEQKEVFFELRLLADVGLVGFPNAGKSTLLSTLTKANPKIANYPFTTLEPNLGVMSVTAGDVVLADIPGIIEGASQGKGLGFTFLRHVQASKVLLFILAIPEDQLFNEELSDTEKGKLFLEQFKMLLNELATYGEGLTEKPYIISVSKVDLYSPEMKEQIESSLKSVLDSKLQKHVFFFSSVTKEGLDELKEKLADQIELNRA